MCNSNYNRITDAPGWYGESGYQNYPLVSDLDLIVFIPPADNGYEPIYVVSIMLGSQVQTST